MNDQKIIVITGATGFLGRQVLSLLVEKGYEIHVIGRTAPTQTNVHFHQFDLLNDIIPHSFWNSINPTHFVHLAWEARPNYFWHAPENTQWLEVSKNLVDEFIKSGGAHLIAAGTCAEYDWQEKTITPWKETRQRKPATLYGQTKHALFEYCVQQANINNIRFAWGRVFHLFGENEPVEKLIASVCNALIQNKPVQCTLGTQKLDFIDVKYAALAFAKLVDNTLSGAINIGSGIEISVAEIVMELGRIAGKPQLIELGAVPMRDDAVAYMIADVTRLRNELKMPKLNQFLNLQQLYHSWKLSINLH